MRASSRFWMVLHTERRKFLVTNARNGLIV